MKYVMGVIAALLFLAAPAVNAACAGVNLLGGGCSQTAGGAVSGSGAVGGSAIAGITAAGSQNTSNAASANLSAGNPLFQGSGGIAHTDSTSTMGSASLGLAGSAAGAGGASSARYNGVGVGGFGLNIFALPTP